MPEYKVTWSGTFIRHVDLPDGLSSGEAVEYIRKHIGLHDLFHSAATVKVCYNEDYTPDYAERIYTDEEMAAHQAKRQRKY